RGERPNRPFYLGFGEDEQRLFGCFLVLLVIMIGIFFASIIIASIIAGLAAQLAGASLEAVQSVTLLVMIFALGVCIWFAARLLLAMPATIAQRRIGIGASWSRTRGANLPVFLYVLFWVALWGLLWAGYIAIAEPDYFGYLSKVFSGVAVGEA